MLVSDRELLHTYISSSGSMTDDGQASSSEGTKNVAPRANI